ncbi:hypothetical protein GCM10010430_25090 [Kitasatospora cystarginea]|uniref:HTH luxR-type domain-containing protein n=1 Tax=Kitasatospora cystarginea TaxID=58350 RepID=A0ABN3DV96_9ACTN
MVEGCNNQSIARQLVVTEAAVVKHAGSIFTFVLPGCPGLKAGEMGVPPPGGWGRVLGSEP